MHRVPAERDCQPGRRPAHGPRFETEFCRLMTYTHGPRFKGEFYIIMTYTHNKDVFVQRYLRYERFKS